MLFTKSLQFKNYFFKTVFDKFYKKIRGDSIKFAIIMCPRVLTIAYARDKIELGEVFAIAKASLSPIVLLKE